MRYNSDTDQKEKIDGRMYDAVKEIQDEIEKLKDEGINECKEAEKKAKRDRKMPNIDSIQPAILQPQTMKTITANALDRYRIGEKDFNSDGLWMSSGEKPKHRPNY